MSVDALLPRLEMVRETGQGRWKARCPAHDDKNPSLSIREAEDGRVLIHCFAGCETLSVLEAVGLKFRDVMPERLEGHRHKPIRRPFNASQLSANVAHEATVAALIADSALPSEDAERLREAVARLTDAAEKLNGERWAS